MTLPEFILGNIESLLDDWAEFARTIPASHALDIVGLRDHAAEMLRAVAADMLVVQSPAQQQRKSEGNAGERPAGDTAAEHHGSARRQSGFEVEQMVAEFRALRATVIRQWLEAARPSGHESLLELVRFNEALDQAVTESLARYVREVDEARELFLGVIAHDMRGPIGASMHAARYLKGLAGLDPSAASALDIVVRSNERLGSITSDILDLVQLKLHPVSVFPMAPVDLAVLCDTMLVALRMNYPGVTMTLVTTGDVRGEWDGPKLERVLSNLVENAIKHGAAGTPVSVRLSGGADEVVLTVSNAGEPIPADQLLDLFEPMIAWTRNTTEPDSAPKSYGLGLYIAREIVRGHRGSICAESSREHGTVFTIRLPCRPSSDASARPDRG